MRDIEDCIVSTDAIKEVEKYDIEHNIEDSEKNLENCTETDIEGDEESFEIVEEEIENIKTNEVGDSR